jgi:acylphosphatase
VATVSGRVQGVGFRWFVQRLAARLEVDGWVANTADGTVRVVAEGTPGGLEALLAALQQGPSGAEVAAVDERWVEATGSISGFSIRSGGHTGD